jgi:myo-inositol-1(or 4)-monophosphatase
MTTPDLLKIALTCAQSAGQYLKEQFHKPHEIASKSHINDLVTECDKTSETLIKNQIKMSLPQSSFLCEESGLETHSSKYLWIIDPLDGTVNFAKKIPFFSVSIALMIEGELELGVIYSPMTDEMFFAQKSKGAFCNHKKLSVTKTAQLQEAFGATGFPYRVQDNVAASLDPIRLLLEKGTPLRRLGSAALDLAYTAAGIFDLFFEASLEAWDYAAGALLVQEAGGLITDFQNKSLNYTKSSSVCAAGKALHAKMIEEVL